MALIENDQLTLTVIGSGATEVTVAAQDPQGAKTLTSFGVIAGEATSTNTDELPPVAFGIGSNYPNPFSGKTVIPVSIPEASVVRVVLFDLLGSEVRTLVRGPVAAGILEIELSSDGLAPGIYLIRLEAGGKTALTSIVVVR